MSDSSNDSMNEYNLPQRKMTDDIQYSSPKRLRNMDYKNLKRRLFEESDQYSRANDHQHQEKNIEYVQDISREEQNDQYLRGSDHQHQEENTEYIQNICKEQSDQYSRENDQYQEKNTSDENQDVSYEQSDQYSRESDQYQEENTNDQAVSHEQSDQEENTNDENDQDVLREEQIALIKVNSKQLKRRRIQEGLTYKDSYNTYKRYDKVSNKKIYLGENISVGLISWEITKNRRKPSLFFNDVLLYIWPENILKNRCLDKNRTTYSPAKVLTPKKLSLALSLYNDYLSELNLSDGKRIKYLCDSFSIISAKIRDVRKKYK